MFSRFSDKLQYDGLTPTGRYLSSIYNKQGKSLWQHYNREVKKRGCKCFHIDASYKAPKCLFQYHGNIIFDALIMATNKFRKVRLVKATSDLLATPCISIQQSCDAME
jgi:hypothetical protein